LLQGLNAPNYVTILFNKEGIITNGGYVKRRPENSDSNSAISQQKKVEEKERQRWW